MTEKSIDPAVVAELEESKNEVLQRVAEKLKKQLEVSCVEAMASHNSHTAGLSKDRRPSTHSSTTSH